MSQKITPTPADSIAPRLKRVVKKQVSVEEIVGSFQDVGKDIAQIDRLVSEEKIVVKQFLATLKSMQPLGESIAVSTSVLPDGLKARGVTQACVGLAGLLKLTFADGHQEVRDLNQTENFDLIVAMACDIAPKFEGLVAEMIEKIRNPPAVEELEETPKVQETQAPALAPEPPLFVPPPVIEEKPPVQLPEEPPKEQPVPAPSPLLVEEGTKITAVTEETLDYLKELGSQVFENSPVSMYFDDWMVNLRQVILSFESSNVIGGDDIFTNECAKIFSNIEDELAKRLMTEAELAASSKTLVENRNLLGQLESGYSTATQQLIVRGKSALDFLINNINHLEKELAEIEKIKTSYLHPLKRMAKEQRRTEIIEKLNGAKKRLALAVQSSAVGQIKADGASGQFDAQTSDLDAKRKIALGFFTKEIDDLNAEIAKLEKLKASTLNLVKKAALEQKIWKTNQNLTAAKKRLQLAEQNSAAEAGEQARLRNEYEKKKQATVGTVKTLEKEIACNEKDNSFEVRQVATEALANAVKARVQRKTAPTQPGSTESEG